MPIQFEAKIKAIHRKEIDIKSPILQDLFRGIHKDVDGLELNKSPPVVRLDSPFSIQRTLTPVFVLGSTGIVLLGGIIFTTDQRGRKVEKRAQPTAHQ